MFLIDYIYWHYSIAPAGILGLLKNYLVGTWHRFLISIHFKTLFSPWHRAQPSDIGSSKTFTDKILNAIIDFYIRIIAVIIRLIIIVAGLIAEVILIIAFAMLLILWLFWPVIFILFVGQGFSLIF